VGGEELGTIGIASSVMKFRSEEDERKKMVSGSHN
jgi:hypothetical protein